MKDVIEIDVTAMLHNLNQYQIILTPRHMGYYTDYWYGTPTSNKGVERDLFVGLFVLPFRRTPVGWCCKNTKLHINVGAQLNNAPISNDDAFVKTKCIIYVL